MRRTITHACGVFALGCGLVACASGDTHAEGSGPGNSFGPTSTSGSGLDTGNSDVDPTAGGTSGADGTSADSTGGDDDPTPTDDGSTTVCQDGDGDGYGVDCEPGPDCDDANDNVWTDAACAACVDADADDYWVGCDAYDEDKPGPDCDDGSDNVWTAAGCAACTDADSDDTWVGCDAYDPDHEGPDCDDANPLVGTTDVVELCDGIAQNCAGEIDPLPADVMCPPPGVTAPNVDVWACNPPDPGVDGCTIAACDTQYFDVDGNVSGGCECAGTPRTESLAACGDAAEGFLGTVAEGDQLAALPVGTIPYIDNGIGAGSEDWYRIEFPQGASAGARPNAGIIQIAFAFNDGNDYRFEVFRGCNGIAWASGLASQYGAAAPPAREWWFFDNHTPPASMPVPALYADNVNWPNTVYVRVFRVQNDGTCNSYQLSVLRQPN